MRTLSDIAARKTGAFASRFRRKESGVVAVEFAFIAPMLVLFLLGTTSVSQSLWAHGKVSQTSSVIGDLIAQQTDLDDTSFRDLVNAGPVLMEPFEVGDLRIEVTSAIACHDDPTDTTNSVPSMFIAWNKGWSGGNLIGVTGGPGDPMAGAPEDLTIDDGDYLVKTEVTYTYAPPFSREAGYEIEMGEIAFHQPRGYNPVSYPSEEGTETANCDDLMNR